jgi:hypothetical protein
MELTDIYKLAHQSVFGPEHPGAYLLKDGIEKEMHSSEVVPNEPLLEPISLHGSSCRINLRAAAKRGITSATVAQAVQSSVDFFSRDQQEFEQLWRHAGAILHLLLKTFSSAEFEVLNAMVKKQRYPSLHHSPSYRLHNRPAYRVMIQNEFEKIRPPSLSSGPSGDLSLE